MKPTINFIFVLLFVIFSFEVSIGNDATDDRETFIKMKCHKEISSAARKLGVQTTKIDNLWSDLNVVHMDLNRIHDQLFSKTKRLVDIAKQLGLIEYTNRSEYMEYVTNNMNEISRHKLRDLFRRVDNLDKIRKSTDKNYKSSQYDRSAKDHKIALAISEKGGVPYLEKLIDEHNSLIEEARSEVRKTYSDDEISKMLSDSAKKTLDKIKKRMDELRGYESELKLYCTPYTCHRGPYQVDNFMLGEEPKLLYTDGFDYYTLKSSEDRIINVSLDSSCKAEVVTVTEKRSTAKTTYRLEKSRCENSLKSNGKFENEDEKEFFKLCTEFASNLDLDLKIKPPIKTFSPGPVLTPPTTR